MSVHHENWPNGLGFDLIGPGYHWEILRPPKAGGIFRARRFPDGDTAPDKYGEGRTAHAAIASATWIEENLRHQAGGWKPEPELCPAHGEPKATCLECEHERRREAEYRRAAEAQAFEDNFADQYEGSPYQMRFG